MGELANDPVNVPFEMVTALSLATHLESLPAVT
jgi:hypothetical protein